MVLAVVMLVDPDQIMEAAVLVDLAALEVEILVDKDPAVSLVETLAVKDLAPLVVEMLEDKGLAVSLVETLVVKDLAALVVEIPEVKGLAVSLGVMLVDRVPAVLETVSDQETRQLVMPMMALMKVGIYLLFPVNQEQTIQYYLKYQKLHLLVTRGYQDIMLTLKLDAKYFIYVLITLSMISYVLMERYSINSTLYVFGGISLIAQLPKVFIA